MLLSDFFSYLDLPAAQTSSANTTAIERNAKSTPKKGDSKKADPNDPTSPVFEKPESLSSFAILSRVGAAALVVASENGVQREQVMNTINADGLYEFAFNRGLDLVTVVREVYHRTVIISSILQDLSNDEKMTVDEMKKLGNWYDVYEMSVQQKYDLKQLMKDAVKHFKESQGQRQTGSKKFFLAE